MKRAIAMILTAVLLCACLGVWADGETWTCPTCGQPGNAGNFCPNCGTARPVYGWTCPYCGQKGNTGMYCINCGNPWSNATPTPLPTPLPTPVPGITVEVNDVITLGSYAGEPIRWQVLALDGTRALLISRYGLERHCFHTNCGGQTWATSALRKWLNGSFYNQVFTRAEAAAIQVTHVNESVTQTYSAMPAKRIGDSTDDRVFLLSYKEMVKYLPDSQMRKCVPTTHALTEGCNYTDKTLLYGQPTCWWWLRTPAYNNNALTVDESGVVDACMMSNSYGAVRPSMWVDLSLLDPATEVMDYWSSFQTVIAPYGTPNPDAAMARSITVTPSPTPYMPGQPTPTPTPTPVPVTWQTAFYDLITSGNYPAGDPGELPPQPAFGLYDLDQDGIPELIIDNGVADADKRTLYVYRFDEMMGAAMMLGPVGIGSGGLYTFQSLPGVLFHSEYDSDTGSHVEETYFWLEDGVLNTRRVYESVSGSDAWVDSEFTSQDTAVSGTVTLFTPEDISVKGWDTFFSSWVMYRG